ncbi:glycosyltransferase family 2 protein [Thioflexithrix psekupsensis]|uniref:Glycosyltransferase 2-like domain-containing protein n=1 Tax=Thioflexithrix psekupsensis TaxID=1570016 RepID=A0A251X704_9GAMM|nr:glycosyltransferase [Thioflexithrix psekupsensis]OUD13474.1 hypothetical protein TPSD3_10280 [Thioflexithrix psekupsensis]
MPNKSPIANPIHLHRKPANAPTIAIIVRTLNRPHLLQRALRSLAEQKRLPDEVIVVNDGGESVAKIVANYPL